jgi:hypothetical protein
MACSVKRLRHPDPWIESNQATNRLATAAGSALALWDGRWDNLQGTRRVLPELGMLLQPLDR